MKVVKRNGEEVDFRRDKIYKAIARANDEVKSENPKYAASNETIGLIVTRLYERCKKRSKATSVEEIRDMVETELMKERAYETAKKFIHYNYVAQKMQNTFLPILYSTDCINCRALKDELVSHNIPYKECKDINIMLELGFDKVPILEVSEGVFLDYNDSIRWVNGGR